ncbi:tetraspanin-8 [Cucurbita pepo subsp. pepo]|uniref:tetraspanin-8 n=1 Tax=Cucurbita pepo subsp. pepo TaxID=3664 RepID=UPI000C9D2FDF|nr:tetraspanin-8 [Cucurbita pepo subsp. pepo]
MVRFSNNLVGILNFIVFLLSIPIIAGGIWLSRQGTSDCEKFLDTPVIVIGVFLLLVSLAGFIGACCRVTWLLWIYLFVMFILIVLLFVFTIFAFAVTNRGAGQVLSNRGYKEYRLGDYSNWLQNRVNNNKNWNKIRSCLVDGKVCTEFNVKFARDTVDQLYQEHLSSIQSGCCKPADECNFVFVRPTEWTVGSTNSTNPDCGLWNNDPRTLCFNCSSCKAGVLDNLKRNWKKVAIINIVVLVFLIIVYSIGCCAFRNNKEENHYPRWK